MQDNNKSEKKMIKFFMSGGSMNIHEFDKIAREMLLEWKMYEEDELSELSIDDVVDVIEDTLSLSLVINDNEEIFSKYN
jgi:uncharacterized Fe-S cluster-containing MiaB family protein